MNMIDSQGINLSFHLSITKGACSHLCTSDGHLYEEKNQVNLLIYFRVI